MNFKHLEKPFPIYDEDYASVAILINSKKEILYIKRSDNLPTHKGDIAFPGGKKEESDSDIVTTALREVQEELFLNPSTIRPFGRPPIPNAMSSPRDPVEMAGITSRGASPIRITAPLPNWRSI